MKRLLRAVCLVVGLAIVFGSFSTAFARGGGHHSSEDNGRSHGSDDLNRGHGSGSDG